MRDKERLWERLMTKADNTRDAQNANNQQPDAQHSKNGRKNRSTDAN